MWAKTILWATVVLASYGQEQPETVSDQRTDPVAVNPRPLLPQPRRPVRPGPARQGGNGQAGFGNLLSGLLNTLTTTADTNECPGKCIHTIASLICDEVREDIQCPSRSMRCCVEKKNKKPEAKEDGVSSTTEAAETTKKVKRKRTTTTRRTTTRKPTTKRTTTTTTPKIDKQDKFGDEDTDYDYTAPGDQNSSGKYSRSSFALSCIGITFAMYYTNHFV